MAPKKGKKTKKQLQEERERLEEENRIKEELERKRQEEENRRRAEEERVRKELEAKLYAEEVKRLSKEIEELQPWYEDYNNQVQQVRKVQDIQISNNKYLSCISRPDALKESDLNTYITLMKERKLHTIEECVQVLQELEYVVRDVQDVLGLAQERRNKQLIKYANDFYVQLRKLARQKIDESTAEVLQYADEYLFAKDEKTQKQKQELVKLAENQVKSKAIDTYIGIWINHESFRYRAKPIDFGELGFQAELPRPCNQQAIVMRAIWTSYDSLLSQGLDYVVGGVFEVGLFDFLQLPKKVKKWTLRSVFSLEDALIPIPYPSGQSMGATSLSNATPLKMIYQLPEYVYLNIPDLRIGWWDFTTEKWSEENIENISLEKDKREIQFTTLRMAPMALLVTRTTDFPYEEWFLRSVSMNKAYLDVKGRRISFQIIIEEDEVMLNLNLQELSHLNQKKTTPSKLLYELARCGILVLPEDRDGEAAGIDIKDQEAEERAILDISLSVVAISYKHSSWNRSLGKNTISVRARQNPEFDKEFAEDTEHDWKAFCWFANKCQLSNLKENAEQPDVKPYEGQESHCHLHLCVQHGYEEQLFLKESLERIQEIQNMKFTETVGSLLRLMRLLSFS